MDEWRRADIELENQPSEKVARSEPAPEVAQTEIKAAMTTKDSVVAVAAEGDPNYDYYLLKLTSHQIEELNTVETDDYGTTFAAGCKILLGNFFVRENLSDMTYKLELKKMAIVHVRTVRCICFDMEVIKKKRSKNAKDVYKVSLEQHEEIMGNI